MGPDWTGTPHSLSGWRQFVDTRIDAPRRLNVTDYAALTPVEQAQYDDDRLDYQSATITIRTDLLDRLTKEMRLLLIANRRQVGAKQGLIVSGPPTTGKTTAILAAGAAVEHLVRQRYPGHDDAPVAFISLPPQATPKSIARAITSFYGINPPHRTTFDELSSAAIGLMADMRTQILIVDEMHNLVLHSRPGAEASDFLKHIAERVQATMIYAGVEVEKAGIFDGLRGRQLAGRFNVLHARPFSHATSADHDVWQSLVSAFEDNTRLLQHKPGSLARLSPYLYTRTGGHIGSLSTLIRKSAISAILDGTERVDRTVLESVSIDFAAAQAELVFRGRQ